MLARVHLQDDVQASRTGIIVGIGHLVVEGQQALAVVQALGIAPEVQQHGGLGIEEELAERVGLQGLIDDGERLLIVTLAGISVHQPGKEVSRFREECKALPQQFVESSLVAETVPGLGSIL